MAYLPKSLPYNRQNTEGSLNFGFRLVEPYVLTPGESAADTNVVFK